MIPHTIIAEQDASYANVKRTVLRVRFDVDTLPSEGALRELVTDLFDNDFPTDYDECTIFGYMPEMDTDGPAYVMAEEKEGEVSFRTSPLVLVGTKWEEDMKMVYIVTEGEYSDYRIVAVSCHWKTPRRYATFLDKLAISGEQK